MWTDDVLGLLSYFYRFLTTSANKKKQSGFLKKSLGEKCVVQEKFGAEDLPPTAPIVQWKMDPSKTKGFWVASFYKQMGSMFQWLPWQPWREGTKRSCAFLTLSIHGCGCTNDPSLASLITKMTSQPCVEYSITTSRSDLKITIRITWIHTCCWWLKNHHKKLLVKKCHLPKVELIVWISRKCLKTWEQSFHLHLNAAVLWT